MDTSKKIVLGVVAILLVLQFFRIEKTTVNPNPANDLLVMEQAPAEVTTILKQACYDCHSYESNYPWYTNIAPVSWWIAHHIDEGREHLNFSEWATYSAKRKAHKMEELIEEVEEGEMPLDSYTWVHGEARLTIEQKEALMTWAREIMKKHQ